jgi:Protein tyrosine and serine/threonine kinase/Concanavalin A-like lectin/glucanases superfamily
VNSGGSQLGNARLVVDDPWFDFNAPGEFTLQVWVRLETLETQTIMEKFSGMSGPGWSLSILGGSSIQFYDFAKGTVSLGFTFQRNVWHQIVVRRGTFTALSIDGQSGSSQTLLAATNAPSANPLLIGHRNLGDGRNYSTQGQLDEIAFWKRELTPTELIELYNSGTGKTVLSGPPTTGPITTATTGTTAAATTASSTSAPATTNAPPTTTAGATTSPPVSTTGSASLTTGSAAATTGLPDAAATSPGEGSDPFPVWIIIVAIGACVCCTLLAVVLVLVHRRRRRGETSSVEMSDAKEVADQENPYDSIANVRDASDLHPVEDVADQYARIPNRAAVEGQYHQVPRNLEDLGAMDVLQASDVMVHSKSIGHGEYGDVFRGVYRGTEVAVKMLKPDFSDAQLQSFYDEAETMACIPAHEHVIGVVGVAPDPFMIVLELADLGSLNHFLRRCAKGQATLTTEQRIGVMKDVAKGMAHLASNGIIHRE